LAAGVSFNGSNNGKHGLEENMRGVALTALFLLHSQAFAADEAGRFYDGGGVGTVRCVEFVSAMEAARRHTYRSVSYWKAIDGYVSYVAGYWTGFNYGWRGRQNIFEGWGIEDVIGKLEGICRENPTVPVFAALVLLTEPLK
jgi:hypothetical protein